MKKKRRPRKTVVKRSRKKIRVQWGGEVVRLLKWVVSIGVGVVFGGGLLVWWWVGHQGNWNGVNRMNVLVVGKNDRQVELVSWSPAAKQLTLLWLGGEVEVPTVWDYGNYRLGVLLDLGEQEKLGYGLLEKSVAMWLGVPIEGVVVVNQLNHQRFDSWGSLRWQLMKAVRGDLSWADRINLFQATAEIYQNQIVSDDLTVGSWYKSEFDPAGGRRIVPVAERVERLAKIYLQDEQVVRVGGVEVAVVNATGHEGLATKAAEVLRRMGYDVVNVTNSQSRWEKSGLMVSGGVKEQGYFLEPIEKVFGVKAQVGEVEPSYRADVVLLVGDDYYRLWYERKE